MSKKARCQCGADVRWDWCNDQHVIIDEDDKGVPAIQTELNGTDVDGIDSVTVSQCPVCFHVLGAQVDSPELDVSMWEAPCLKGVDWDDEINNY